MKKIVFVLLLCFSVLTCKKSKTKSQDLPSEKELDYVSFGYQITSENTLTSEEMLAKFSGLKEGDTISVKFTSIIKDVCSKKGCWMKLPLNDTEEVMVRFKDYGFFIPLDTKGKEVIVNGKAFAKETSVEELRHYAEDEGRTKEEIAKITAPRVEFSFEADGVLLKK